MFNSSLAFEVFEFERVLEPRISSGMRWRSHCFS